MRHRAIQVKLSADTSYKVRIMGGIGGLLVLKIVRKTIVRRAKKTVAIRMQSHNKTASTSPVCEASKDGCHEGDMTVRAESGLLTQTIFQSGVSGGACASPSSIFRAILNSQLCARKFIRLLSVGLCQKTTAGHVSNVGSALHHYVLCCATRDRIRRPHPQEFGARSTGGH
jgi:hypothetical protein